jgi:riboflavin kinase/FMN adenylyltransferase
MVAIASDGGWCMTAHETRPKAVATIGAFDGVHLGHRALLGHVVQRASALHATSWCVTFNPHPDVVMRPERQHTYLATLEDRIGLIREQGIQTVKVFEFTRRLSSVTPEEFVDMMQVDCKLVELWVGPDFAMGRGRSGTPKKMEEIGQSHGFSVAVMEPHSLDGEIVSSTRIRALLAAGELADAAVLLGRPYSLRGTVESGAGRGTPLGFPTANVRPPGDMTMPADGVYVVLVCVDGDAVWPGVANFGGRPTFKEHERLIEAHLFDFSGDLRGKSVDVRFLHRIRPVQAFPSIDALIAQIRKDVAAAREWFVHH